MNGTSVDQAFRVSIRGADLVGEDPALYLEDVTGLDDKSIVAAIRLAGYDSAFRAGLPAYRPVSEIEVGTNAIENVRAMVAAGMVFFAEYGSVVHDGITFPGGYTEIVDSGDGDFMTADTIWDFKVTVKPPTKEHTLQIAMYWLMGLHSQFAGDYRNVRRLGFFNPRLATVYTIEVAGIPIETLHEIEVQVIGYAETEAIY